MSQIEYKFKTQFTGWFDFKSPVFPTRVSLLACILLAAGGIIVGSLEKSLAVETNGMIAAIEILNSMLFIAAVSQSVRTPDYSFNYGYGKYESLAILSGAVLLTVVLIKTLISGIQEFSSPILVGNYYILVSFSIFSLLVIQLMFLYLKKASKKYFMPLLDYDAAMWKVDSYIESGVLINLIIGAILGFLGYAKIAKMIDSASAIILIVYALKIPLTHGKDALNQLLDRTLPESIQFDIIAVIAENVNRMCEYKKTYTRRSGKDIFIEIDVVMPWDFTLEEAFSLEKDIHESIKIKYPTALPRLYVTPCQKDCVKGDVCNCPVKIAMQQKMNNSQNNNLESSNPE
ncbi:MAG: cation diffusion facilitator family transporter [Bacteroidota bacterium]